MEAKGTTARAARRTFTETARRAQIVEAAIATIAELGYARASFARIAERAGLSSTGLISYHFAGKDALIAQIIADVYGALAGFMAGRMAEQAGAADALRIYIEASAAFIGAHRTEMRALLAIFMQGGLPYGAATERAVVSPLEALLRRGQAGGEFRAFDTTVMAAVIQRAVDGLPFLLASSPDLDADTYAREVATLFALATRRAS